MTPAQKRDYEAQGYLVIENGFDSGKLNELSSALDRLAAADELEDLPNGDDCFIHLTLDPAFFPIVHRIMSDDVQLRTLRGGLCAPGTSELDWHRSVASLLGVAHEVYGLRSGANSSRRDAREWGLHRGCARQPPL